MDSIPVPTISLNLIQTLGLAALVYAGGEGMKVRIRLLERLNIPSAVLGGLCFSALVFLAHDRWVNIQLDTSTQPLFMIAFFTTIGMGASVALLKKGGPQVVRFLFISTLFCVVQNAVGGGIAGLFGVSPLLGVMAGSVTLVGGPATGLAFAPLFERAGLAGADVIAIGAATFGIVFGGLAGGPVGTWLIHRHSLHGPKRARGPSEPPEPALDTGMITPLPGRELTPLLGATMIVALGMGAGSLVSAWIESLGITLPAYIGAMVVASIVRNSADRTARFRLNEQAMEFIGSVSLNIFLVVALMNLSLWKLAALALPLLVILAAQVIITSLVGALLVYRSMGRDFDAAVMSGGFIGFALGTTANAVANMGALVRRYGAAPRAFLVVPLVGAFFIDFVNAILITVFLNWFR
jgi:ESS family glutamate:Na+ symporter